MRSLWHQPLLFSLTVSPVPILSAQTAHSDQIVASYQVVDSSRSVVATIATGAEVSPGNPWYTAGFQLGYRLGGNTSFSDGIVASARTTILLLNDLLRLGQSKLQLPVVGNLGKLTAAIPSGSDDLQNAATELLNTAEGISVELAPYFLFRSIDTLGQTGVGVTAFGSVGFKVNAAWSLADSSTLYLGQRRVTLGVEFSFKIHRTDPRPFTLSFGGTSTWFDRTKYSLATGKNQSLVKSFDVTVILPVAGFGLLTQASVASHTKALWRVGVLVAKKNQ